MKSILKVLSYLGLAMTVLPSVLVFAGKMEKELHYSVMIAGMVLWFVTAVLWVKPDQHQP
ncbi:hypothetical protein [Pelagicoccus sp. SDUM812005]|uniref:hypothetical protein n=1 Tax=Pelagicoccus sp. SDUM812005 TaxID=3041257 RepID=UPI00280D1AC2|nr:hypothetical protein [Pelagicoccus sp. SDUM812005]MDQ8179362.1 hypothetical protein [Pelagicoccus sp. SDUM812005]